MSTVEPAEKMRKAASGQRTDVLNSEDRCLEEIRLSSLLRSVDLYWRDFPDEAQLRREVEAFDASLRKAGVRTVPSLGASLGQALRRKVDQRVTLKFDVAHFGKAESDLQEMVLTLTTWSPGAPPGRVFASEDPSEATVTEAAENLCMMCVQRERLAEPQRSHTHDVLHLLAPQLSPQRLDTVESCLQHIEEDQVFDGVLRPGLTGLSEIGVIPIWLEPTKACQRWTIAAGHSWVLISTADEVTSEDTDRVIHQMVPRWERSTLPRCGDALSCVLVEVAIESAARRAQALGRVAEEVFPLGDEQEIRKALNRLAKDLAELNAGLDELEAAAADSRTDLERRLTSIPRDCDEAALYRSLRASLDEALAKLDRQQQRLQGSFLAAREHASAHHVAETINQLRQQQEDLAWNQKATEKLNKMVGRLTIVLLGPTLVLGALSVTDTWIRPKEYAVSIGLLLLYVFAGLAASMLIRRWAYLFTPLVDPRVPTRAKADLEAETKEA